MIPLAAMIRNPHDLLDAGELSIYNCLIGHLEAGTSFMRAVLRCAQDSNVPRTEVMRVIRKANPEWDR